MNKIKFPVISIIICLVLLSMGCGVGKVSAPVSSSTTSSVANVNVTLASSSIANGGSTTVTATVSDASANPVPNATVSFSVISSAAGACNPTSAVTDASGVATTTFTAATNDTTATIMATVTVGTSSVSDSATITIGTPARVPTSIIVALGSPTIALLGNTTVTATVSDASGGISGLSVSFSIGGFTTGSLSATSAVTNASGVATVTFTDLSTPGPGGFVTITASYSSMNNSATLQIGSPPPPTPATMSFSISPLSIGLASQTTANISLHASDGSPAFSAPCTLTVSDGTLAHFAGSATTLNVTTDTSGNASAIVYSGTSSGAPSVTATCSPLASQSAGFNITSDPYSITLSLSSGQSPTIYNGESRQLDARVLNNQGQPVSEGTIVTFAIVSGNSGALSATTAGTYQGHAYISFTADSVNFGGTTISATAGSLPAAQMSLNVSQAGVGSITFVSAIPSVINTVGNGTSSSIIKFNVINSVGAPMPNTPVTFQLNGPTGSSLTTLSGTTDANGNVTTILQAGPVSGQVTITASTASGASTQVTTVSIGGGMPSMKFLSLSVSRINLDGLYCDGVTSDVMVLMADRFGNVNILQGTSVSFSTDFGGINTSNVVDNVGHTTSQYRTQNPRPPDGRVKIVARTTGEESFTDIDTDGTYSSSIDYFDPADDLGEPYLDSNNSGTHNANETYWDWPSSVYGAIAGVYNNPNGRWDGNIPIWRSIDVWMTGPPKLYTKGTTTNPASQVKCCDPADPLCGSESASLIASGGTTTQLDIPSGGHTVCYVYPKDENGRTLIAGTSISLSSSAVGTVSAVSISDYSGNNPLVDGAADIVQPVGYIVTNSNTSGSPADATLSATINWTGSCNTQKLIVPFGIMLHMQ